MGTATITVPAEEDTKRAYEESSAQEKKKIELLLGLRLRQIVSGKPRSLDTVMNEMSRVAAERGMTPEIPGIHPE